MMKLYLIASNRYNYLIQPFSVLFNKYWFDQEVVVLLYDIPKVELPNNFSMISLGEQSTSWTNPLIKFFTEQCKDKYFMINLEDMFLVDYVNEPAIRKLEKEIQEGRADKASLHFYTEEVVVDRDDGFVELKQDAWWRYSIHPSIWTREYWLKALQPNQTLWEFEKGKRVAKNDGGRIIFLKEQLCPIVLFDTCNVRLKGRVDPECTIMRKIPYGTGLMHEEDIPIMESIEHKI